MTRYLRTDGKLSISWDDESEPVDWTTPNVGDGIDDEYCGNCGLDSPGCGCPRDPHYDGTDPALLPVQKRDDPPAPLNKIREPACGRCDQRSATYPGSDPARGRFCAACADRCHEATDFAHICEVCAAPGEQYP